MKHEFVKALHERYKKEGIVIPFPIRTLDLPAGSQVTIARSVSERLRTESESL